MRVELICDELDIKVESCVIKKSNVQIIMSWDGMNWIVTWDGIIHINGCHNLVIKMPINGD
jgi:hypothetical protein